MRILVLCPYVPFPPTHGGRIRSGVMVRALARRWQVDVLAPIPEPSIDGGSGRAAAERLRAEWGVTVHPLAVATTPRASAPLRKLANWARGRSDVVSRRFGPAALRAAKSWLRAQHEREATPTLLVADTTFATPLWHGVAPTVPRILNLHNIEAEVIARLGRGGLATRVESEMVRRIEAREASRAALTITVSARDRDTIRSLAPGALVTAIDNSIDLQQLDRLAAPRFAGPPTLLFVGSFEYPPNLQAARDLIARHLPVLRAAFAGLRVRLVGRDTGDCAVAQLASAHPDVEAVGFVDDLRTEYAAATAVYVPLSSGGGTRIKVLEAMALGRPVIASELAVEGLDLEPGRDYLPCDSPELGVSSLCRLRDDHTATAAMLTRGRNAIEQRYGHAVAEARFVESFAELQAGLGPTARTPR